MTGRKFWMGMASLSIAGSTLVGMSTAAWALHPVKITVSDPGGDNGPYVQGKNFTPSGTVKITEWAVGTATPYAKFKLTAGSTGMIAGYGVCDGNVELQFRAKDVATGAKTAKTAPATYPCIG
jgi:hypothetical protein